MIKLNIGFDGGRGGRVWGRGRGDGVRIKVMRTRVYQKLAAEDKLN